MSSSTILTQSVFESLRNTYLLEYLVEEIRVTVKSDIKISLNDINIIKRNFYVRLEIKIFVNDINIINRYFYVRLDCDPNLFEKIFK